MPEVGYQYAADEIAAALTWTRRRAEAELNFAWELADLAAVGQYFAAGQIDLAKAKTIVYGLTGIDSEVATEVAEKVLERAGRQTTGQIRARMRRLLLEINPQAAADRYQAGLNERKVVLDANDDGTATLHLYNLAPDQAALAFDRIDSYARALGTGDEPRTLDQLRGDVATDLLLGCLQHQERARKPIVDIRVDLTTLLELNDDPGEVPSPPAEAGGVAADTGGGRGGPRGNARDRARTPMPATCAPSPSLRSGTPPASARGEGCRAPSIHSDIDHRKRWIDGGPTDDPNLQPLCDHNHGTKDQGGWHLELIDPATFQWTSPLGIKHLVEIEPP